MHCSAKSVGGGACAGNWDCSPGNEALLELTTYSDIDHSIISPGLEATGYGAHDIGGMVPDNVRPSWEVASPLKRKKRGFYLTLPLPLKRMNPPVIPNIQVIRSEGRHIL